MIKKVVAIISIVIILIVAGYIGYKTYILNKYKGIFKNKSYNLTK